jgi:hypothetical protein
MNKRYACISPLTPLFALLTLIGPSLLSAEDNRPLSEGECAGLYAHQLAILSTDGVVQRAIAQSRKSLESDPARRDQIAFCIERIGHANYLCQKSAKTAIGLGECHRLHGGPAQPGEAAAANGGATPGVIGVPARADGHERSSDPIQRIASPSLPVNPVNCRKAYDHLLSVFSKSPDLEKSPDRDMFLNYWNSKEARDSFESRCARLYKPSDIGCILSSKERHVLQACIMQVPER